MGDSSNDHRTITDPGNDRYSVDARKSKVYWLCQCGLARTSVNTMEEHCLEEGHNAEKLDTENNVTLATLKANI